MSEGRNAGRGRGPRPGGERDGGAAAAVAPAPCEHLIAPLEALAREGLSVVAVREDEALGRRFVLDRPIPFAALRRLRLPPFVHLQERLRLVFCERCWESLAGGARSGGTPVRGGEA